MMSDFREKERLISKTIIRAWSPIINKHHDCHSNITSIWSFPLLLVSFNPLLYIVCFHFSAKSNALSIFFMHIRTTYVIFTHIRLFYILRKQNDLQLFCSFFFWGGGRHLKGIIKGIILLNRMFCLNIWYEDLTSVFL